eukprot:1029546-Prymnesium_polylepis.1
MPLAVCTPIAPAFQPRSTLLVSMTVPPTTDRPRSPVHALSLPCALALGSMLQALILSWPLLTRIRPRRRTPEKCNRRQHSVIRGCDENSGRIEAADSPAIHTCEQGGSVYHRSERKALPVVSSQTCDGTPRSLQCCCRGRWADQGDARLRIARCALAAPAPHSVHAAREV